MAYYVYCDDKPIHDMRDEDLVLIDPQVKLEVNKAGSLSFTMPPDHPQYDLPQRMTSRIRVLQDGEEIFNGRPVQVKTDFYNRKYVYCEGQLAFLNDSIQRPGEYHDMTVREYLEILIASHNEQVDESRQFEVGIVTVTDTNDSLYRYTNMNSTMDEIKDDLVDDLGGYLKVRNVYDTDGTLLHRYLDYVTISDYGNTNSQAIEFGENLMDFTRDIDMTDICTAIIPLGATLEESDFTSLEVRLTIEDVNDGCDYIQIDEAVETYGFILKTVTWDSVTTAAMLLSKAKAYLTDYQYDGMTIEAKAVDLHYTDEDFEAFRLGDMIRVLSKPHGLDKYFPLTKMTIYLNKLESNTITLGTYEDTSLTAKTNKVSSGVTSVENSIPVAAGIIQSAVNQATALITAATHGYVVTTADEILIMDTNDVETAAKVWRWNVNGLGYSSTGYNGTFGTAITMDGQIVGSYILANSISASALSAEYTTQVEQEIADAEESATSSANDYTDSQLTSYYTKSEVTTAIKNSADSVTLSVNEYAVQYVDGQLKNYYTASQIDVLVDSINISVTGSLGGTASIVLSVDGDDISRTLDLSDIRKAFASDTTSITISAGTVTFASNTLIVSSNNFTLDSGGNATFSGKLDAPSGKIGGWTISSSALYNGTSSMSSTTAGTFIGTAGIRQYASTSAYVNIASGVLTAKGASISGSITATSGTIGTLTISGGFFYNGTENRVNYSAGFAARASSGGSDSCMIWCGSNFAVDYRGYLYESSRGEIYDLYYVYLQGSSDRRLKNDCGDLGEDEYLTLLRGLNAKKFTFKDDANSKLKYGYYAQDVRDLLIDSGIGYRDLLGITKNSEIEGLDRRGDTITDLLYNEDEVEYGLDYTQFVPILTSGWQYHDNLILTLRAEIEALKQQIKELNEKGEAA